MFTEDLTVFFNPVDFAVVATYGAGTVNGLFSADFAGVLGIEDAGPAFACASADVSGIAHGSDITINGTAYKVRGIEQDGTGIVLLILEDQTA